MTLDGDWLERGRQAMDRKVKPPGSLGRLEEVAARLAALLQTLEPRLDLGRILIFAADHGVSVEGVSAYPREVTAQMLGTFSSGGAAISVLCRSLGLQVEVIDVGVDADGPALDGIVDAKVRRGSRSFLRQAAMTSEELDACFDAGRAAVDRALAAGVQTIGLGEMGIGNTTAAAALLSALTGAPASETVGRGTGVTEAGLLHKQKVVEAALELHGPSLHGPRDALAAVGGLEMAALAGAALAAGEARIPVLVDGFISTVAILAAVRMRPSLRRALFFAHRSEEKGHGLALEALGARPLLDLGLRLGEGTGSALAFPVLQAAAAVLREMATFSQAGVSGSEVEPTP